jgi:hypothetical protein
MILAEQRVELQYTADDLTTSDVLPGAPANVTFGTSTFGRALDDPAVMSLAERAKLLRLTVASLGTLVAYSPTTKAFYLMRCGTWRPCAPITAGSGMDTAAAGGKASATATAMTSTSRTATAPSAIFARQGSAKLPALKRGASILETSGRTQSGFPYAGVSTRGSAEPGTFLGGYALGDVKLAKDATAVVSAVVTSLCGAAASTSAVTAVAGEGMTAMHFRTPRLRAELTTFSVDCLVADNRYPANAGARVATFTPAALSSKLSDAGATSAVGAMAASVLTEDADKLSSEASFSFGAMDVNDLTALAAASTSDVRRFGFSLESDMVGVQIIGARLLKASRRMHYKSLRDVTMELTKPTHETPLSGQYLCGVMHRRGINLRSLGAAASIIDDQLRVLRSSPHADPREVDSLQHGLVTVKLEMAARVFRFVLRLALAGVIERFIAMECQAMALNGGKGSFRSGMRGQGSSVGFEDDEDDDGDENADPASGFFVAFGESDGENDTDSDDDRSHSSQPTGSLHDSSAADSDEEQQGGDGMSGDAPLLNFSFLGSAPGFRPGGGGSSVTTPPAMNSRSFRNRAAAARKKLFNLVRPTYNARDTLDVQLRTAATQLLRTCLGSEVDHRTQKFWSAILVPGVRRKYGYYGSLARAEFFTGPASARLRQLCGLEMASVIVPEAGVSFAKPVSPSRDAKPAGTSAAATNDAQRPSTQGRGSRLGMLRKQGGGGVLRPELLADRECRLGHVTRLYAKVKGAHPPALPYATQGCGPGYPFPSHLRPHGANTLTPAKPRMVTPFSPEVLPIEKLPTAIFAKWIAPSLERAQAASRPASGGDANGSRGTSPHRRKRGGGIVGSLSASQLSTSESRTPRARVPTKNSGSGATSNSQVDNHATLADVDATPYRLAYSLISMHGGDHLLAQAEAGLRTLLHDQERAWVSVGPAVAETQFALAEVYVRQHRYTEARVRLEKVLRLEATEGRGSCSPLAARCFEMIARLARDSSDKGDAVGASEAALSQLLLRLHRSMKDVSTGPILRRLFDLRRYPKAVLWQLTTSCVAAPASSSASPREHGPSTSTLSVPASPGGKKERRVSIATFITDEGGEPSSSPPGSLRVKGASRRVSAASTPQPQSLEPAMPALRTAPSKASPPSATLAVTSNSGADLTAAAANVATGAAASTSAGPPDAMLLLARESARADALAHFVGNLDDAHLALITRASEGMSALYGIVNETDLTTTPFAVIQSCISLETAKSVRSRRRTTTTFDGHESDTLTSGESSRAASPRSGRQSNARTPRSSSRRGSVSSCSLPEPLQPRVVTWCVPQAVASPVAMVIAAGGGVSANPSFAGHHHGAHDTLIPATADTERLLVLNHLFSLAAGHVAEYEHLSALRVLRRCSAIATVALDTFHPAAKGGGGAPPTASGGSDEVPGLVPVLRAAVHRSAKNLELVRAAVAAGTVTPKHGT